MPAQRLLGSEQDKHLKLGRCGAQANARVVLDGLRDGPIGLPQGAHRRVRRGLQRGAERAILDTVEHHAHLRLRPALTR